MHMIELLGLSTLQILYGPVLIERIEHLVVPESEAEKGPVSNHLEGVSPNGQTPCDARRRLGPQDDPGGAVCEPQRADVNHEEKKSAHRPGSHARFSIPDQDDAEPAALPPKQCEEKKCLDQKGEPAGPGARVEQVDQHRSGPAGGESSEMRPGLKKEQEAERPSENEKVDGHVLVAKSSCRRHRLGYPIEAEEVLRDAEQGSSQSGQEHGEKEPAAQRRGGRGMVCYGVGETGWNPLAEGRERLVGVVGQKCREGGPGEESEQRKREGTR